MHVRCAATGCGYVAKACYNSLQAHHLQSWKCPKHPGRDDRLRYHFEGLLAVGAYRAVPDPAQWRNCHRSCCGKPVRFVTYCLLCGYPEDLCAQRLDQLRLAPHFGHNQYTQCAKCPSLVGMTIVPATGYNDVDWAQFEEADFCIPDLLLKAGAEAAWPTIRAFMKRSGLTTWGSFLNRFTAYVNSWDANLFQDMDGHKELCRMVIGQLIVTEIHKQLFHKQRLCYDVDQGFSEPPTAFPGVQHSMQMQTVLQTMSDVVRQYTARTARAFKPLDMLVLHTMAALARPGRVIQIVSSEEHPHEVLLVDVAIPPRDAPVPSLVLGAAECPSMFSPGQCWLGVELRRRLETPSIECPDEGVYADSYLPLVGPIFA